MPGAIFDLDGTLIDSWAAHLAAWRGIGADLGHELTEAEFSSQFGLKNEPIIASLFKSLGRDCPDAAGVEAIALDKEARFRALLGEGGFPFMPGVLDLMQALRVAGWALAVGSSAPKDNIDFALARFDAAGVAFDAVACGCDVEHGKPAPDVFLLAASRLGVGPDRCVVFEDAPAGIEAARRAGMASVGVASTGRAPEALAAADLVIEAFGALTPETLTALL